jgi:hypothetical protein
MKSLDARQSQCGKSVTIHSRASLDFTLNALSRPTLRKPVSIKT